jgi:hypothetical protein
MQRPAEGRATRNTSVDDQYLAIVGLGQAVRGRQRPACGVARLGQPDAGLAGIIRVAVPIAVNESVNTVAAAVADEDRAVGGLV